MRWKWLNNLLLLTALLAGGSMDHARPTVAAQEPAGGEAFRPKWRVGDAWIVETQTRQLQAREADGPNSQGAIVRWRFHVQSLEKVAGRDCFRVTAECVSQAGPRVILWIDSVALALRQTQTQMRVGGELRTLTESYEFAGDQPTPVVGPLTALPIDLPLFLGGPTKGTQAFQYESIPGPVGTKALGDVGFSFQVEQGLDTPEPKQVEGLLYDDFAKSLTPGQVVEVQLKTADRQVKQLWQPGMPWPAYSNNGATVARLIKVIPAPAADNR
ncbi:MAG: hypothetical protein AB7O38_05300 [Pirellulaceae bacterium]